MRESFANTVLQEEVVSRAEVVAGIKRFLLTQDGQELLILRANDGVENTIFTAQRVRAIIDERLVFQVLVVAPINGIDRDEVTGKRESALI